jgi:hypothetical protein
MDGFFWSIGWLVGGMLYYLESLSAWNGVGVGINGFGTTYYI